jgi:uncharacterized membrane protein YdcZ (DUF606 family)
MTAVKPMRGDRKMASKTDLVVGALVFIVGLIILSFAPGFPFAGSNNLTSQYFGGFLAIIVGLIGVALYRNIGRVEVGVSIVSILLGLAFILDTPGMLYLGAQPQGMATEAVGALTAIIGLVGVGAALVSKRSTVAHKA